eukprot:UN06308
MPPTPSIESTSTPSPILQIVPRITGSSETSVSDTISVENIDAVENNGSTDILVVYLMNNLVVSVLCGLIILGALLCVICYCCIKQRYTFKRRLKNDDVENVQIKPAVNAKNIFKDKERVATQTHLSFSIQIDENSVGNNSPYNNINYDAFGRRSASFNNGLSIISPSSMVNISPHLAVPVSPINEYKEESVSPIASPIVSPIVSLSVLPPPPPPSTYDNDNDDMEGIRIHKEDVTMIINEQFIISQTNDRE